MKCGRVMLRPLEKRDMELLRSLLNDPDIAGSMIDHSFPVSADMQQEWFEKNVPYEKAHRFMIEADGATVGTIVFSKIDTANKSGQVGYKVARAFQGRSYATCALQAMQRYLFDDVGIECIIAYHFKSNISSRRVLEKAGFRYEGIRRKHVYKNGQRQDVVYWSCDRGHTESIREDMQTV